jgi:hypothetical protein
VKGAGGSKSKLWHGHAATPAQSLLEFPNGTGRKTQADVLTEMLRAARAQGRALQLPEIMLVGIAQHGARLSEIRARGFKIENETKRAPDGRTLSSYTLTHDPERDER